VDTCGAGDGGGVVDVPMVAGDGAGDGGGVVDAPMVDGDGAGDGGSVGMGSSEQTHST